MKKYIATTFCAFALLAGTLSCNDDDRNAPLVLPSELEVIVTVDPKRPSSVSVVAAADDVNFYNVYFGDAAAEVPVRTVDGKATHTYAAVGTYTIRVQAHTTTRDYVKTE